MSACEVFPGCTSVTGVITGAARNGPLLIPWNGHSHTQAGTHRGQSLASHVLLSSNTYDSLLGQLVW